MWKRKLLLPDDAKEVSPLIPSDFSHTKNFSSKFLKIFLRIKNGFSIKGLFLNQSVKNVVNKNLYQGLEKGRFLLNR